MSYLKLLSAKMSFWWFCQEVLDRLAPGKQKYFRGKNTSFMNNNLNKEIMKRLRLRHKFFTSGNDADRKRNTKQQNICVSPLRKTQNNYFKNIHEKNFTDNKKF